MKFLLIAILTMCMGLNIQLQAQAKTPTKKILVVYFSWSNSGNTRHMAEQIKAMTGADIFEIVPVKAYPRDYQACVDQAKAEINSDSRPEIKGKIENFDSYDIIFVGSPNWWSTIAPPVATLLSGYDFSGKTILPFITHEGSRMGRSMDDIKKLCPKANVLQGLPVRGGSVKNAENDIRKWLRDNEMIN
ncbi:MAG: flavodoxin [Dysgonomonas sp.]|nr:flavodoxin [Dysgonomonas sp.]